MFELSIHFWQKFNFWLNCSIEENTLNFFSNVNIEICFMLTKAIPFFHFYHPSSFIPVRMSHKKLCDAVLHKLTMKICLFPSHWTEHNFEKKFRFLKCFFYIAFCCCLYFFHSYFDTMEKIIIDVLLYRLPFIYMLLM